MIDRTKAVTEARVGLNGAGDELFGGGDGFEQARALGEARRDRRRVGAAGPVRVGRLDPFSGKGMKPALGVEQVRGVGDPVAAFDENCLRAEIGDRSGGVFEHR